MQVANLTSPMAVVVMDTSGAMAGAASNPLNVQDASVVSAVQAAQGAVVSAVTAGANVQPGYNGTPISSNGTTTIASAALYYGLLATSLGTLWAVSVYDVVNGTNTKPITQNVSIGALGLTGLAGPPGIGYRLQGMLTVVTSGTLAGNLNCLWD